MMHIVQLIISWLLILLSPVIKSLRTVAFTCVLSLLTTINLLGADPNGENLREVIRRLQPKLKAEATEMDLMYWPGLLSKFPDLQYLTTNARQYKPAAVDLVIEGAREKGRSGGPMPFINTPTLLIGAMYGLTPTDYLEFADQVFSRAEAERVDLDDAEFSALISPLHNLTGLFAWNYQHPHVRETLEKAKRLWVAQSPAGKMREPDLAKVIDDILSGQTAQWLDRQKERYPEEYPNNLEPPILVTIKAKPSDNVADETTPAMKFRPSTPIHSGNLPTEPAVQAPAAEGARRAQGWLLAVGIAVIAMIAFLFWKRRS